jgi:hypothetical protein
LVDICIDVLEINGVLVSAILLGLPAAGSVEGLELELVIWGWHVGAQRLGGVLAVDLVDPLVYPLDLHPIVRLILLLLLEPKLLVLRLGKFVV